MELEGYFLFGIATFKELCYINIRGVQSRKPCWSMGGWFTKFTWQHQGHHLIDFFKFEHVPSMISIAVGWGSTVIMGSTVIIGSAGSV